MIRQQKKRLYNKTSSKPSVQPKILDRYTKQIFKKILIVVALVSYTQGTCG